jgi:hypothetical protein
MKVTTLGNGRPDVAIVAAVHGDEPAGVRAIERLEAEAPAVDRPVKLIVANEAALERGDRYLDEDLNRSFPGDPDGDSHERRLAAKLAAELEGCTTLSIHSTQSHPEPFAVVRAVTDHVRDFLPDLPIVAVVETGDFVEGRLFESVERLVEVEAGRQGTDRAAENAYRVARAFLDATGVVSRDGNRDGDEDGNGDEKAGGTVGDVPVFRLTGPVAKPPADRYELFVENFRRVAAGERFAAADGNERTADEEFYPVLMSANGYTDVYGYAADRVGTIGGTVE